MMTKEELRKRNRVYYERWRMKDAARYVHNSAKRRASKTGAEFSIEVEDVVIPTHCPILGVELKVGGSNANKWHSPSLDRKDNTKGYVKGNVSVISMKANQCKSDLTPSQIEALYKYVFDL